MVISLKSKRTLLYKENITEQMCQRRGCDALLFSGTPPVWVWEGIADVGNRLHYHQGPPLPARNPCMKMHDCRDESVSVLLQVEPNRCTLSLHLQPLWHINIITWWFSRLMLSGFSHPGCFVTNPPRGNKSSNLRWVSKTYLHYSNAICTFHTNAAEVLFKRPKKKSRFFKNHEPTLHRSFHQLWINDDEQAALNMDRCLCSHGSLGCVLLWLGCGI